MEKKQFYVLGNAFFVDSSGTIYNEKGDKITGDAERRIKDTTSYKTAAESYKSSKLPTEGSRPTLANKNYTGSVPTVASGRVYQGKGSNNYYSFNNGRIYIYDPNNKSNNGWSELKGDEKTWVQNQFNSGITNKLNPRSGNSKFTLVTSVGQFKPAEERVENVTDTSDDASDSASGNPYKGVIPRGSHSVSYTGNDGWKFNSSEWGGGGRRGSLGDLATKAKGLDLSGIQSNARLGEAGRLQTFLKNQGYNITIDGYAGKQTQAALNDYLTRRDALSNALGSQSYEEASVIPTGVDLRVGGNPFGEGSAAEQAALNIRSIRPDKTVADFGYNISNGYLVSSDTLKQNGITDFSSLSNYYNNANDLTKNSDLYKSIHSALANGNFIKDGAIDLTAFESGANLSGHYGNRDRSNLASYLNGNNRGVLENAASAASRANMEMANNAKTYYTSSDYDAYKNLSDGLSRGIQLDSDKSSTTFNSEDINNMQNYFWNGSGENRKLYFRNNDRYFTLDADGKIREAKATYNFDNNQDLYNVSYNKNGGTMNKINYFLAGGPAPATAPAQGGEDMQAQIVQLVQAAMSGDEQATQTINLIMQAAQQGDQQATQIAQMIQQVAQQMQGQAQAAKRGAKLAYIHSLRTGCPEGEEAVYTMKNGGVCKACVKKACNGSKAKKVQEGGEVPEEKCGGKAKKHFFGGLLNLIG